LALFATARCRVRNFEERDLDALMSYRNDMTWMRYQGFKGLQRAEYERVLLAPPDWVQGVQLAVTDSDDVLIGDLYVREDPDQTEIGFAVAPQHARQGYMTEAVRGLVTYLRGTSDKPIVAEADPHNAASIRLLQRLGFRHVGTSDGWEGYVK
jgi:ribosomal-protein-alanine N-acetyltransferase